MHTYSPPTFWFGRCQLADFISLWWPFFYPFLPLVPPEVFLPLCPKGALPKGSADLCTSILGHIPHHPLHTHQWPKCVQWSHRRYQKWCMHRECAHRDTCTRFCTLGLNLSMTLGAETFLTGFKKKKFLGGKKATAQLCPLLSLPLFAYDLLCAHPTPSLFRVTKIRQRSNLRRGFWTILSFSMWMERYMLLLGSIILGGYVYIVKYILPNQETEEWESLQWELGHWWWTREVKAWGGGRGEVGKHHLVARAALPLSAPSSHVSPLAPSHRQCRGGHQKKAGSLKGSFPTLHTNR